MKTKIKFNDIAGMLERDEMKGILGGTGSPVAEEDPIKINILPVVMEAGGAKTISFSIGTGPLISFTVPKDTVWGGQLNEVIIPPKGSSAEQTFNAVAFGWDMKTMLSEIAIGGDAAGMEAQYLKYLEGAGFVGLAIGGAFVFDDIQTKGLHDYHVADLGTQALIYGAASVVPVAGWALGAAYFLGNYYTERNYGEGLYEHLNAN
jgi:hypothetical protein